MNETNLSSVFLKRKAETFTDGTIDCCQPRPQGFFFKIAPPHFKGKGPGTGAINGTCPGNEVVMFQFSRVANEAHLITVSAWLLCR